MNYMNSPVPEVKTLEQMNKVKTSKCIGKGAFGKVYKVLFPNGENYAVKVISYRKLQSGRG